MISGLALVVKQYFYMWSIEILRQLRVAIALPVPAQNCFYLPGPSSSHGHSEWNLLTASTATVSSHTIRIHGNWVLFCKYKAIFCVYLTPMDQLLNFANNHGLFSQLSHFFLTQLNKENWETWQSWKRILSWWKRAVKLVANHSRCSYYWVIWLEPASQKRFIQGILPFLLCSTLTKWYDNNRNRKTVHTFCFYGCLSYSAKTR